MLKVEVQTAENVSSSREVMAPAFDSGVQAGLFGLLLVVLLLLPIFIAKTHAIARRDVYMAMPAIVGPYAFVGKEIFDESSELDVLFLGNSYVWAGIDTPAVKEALSEHSHPDAKVVTFGSDWAGLDVMYAQLRDLLKRRRVRMVVLSVPPGLANDEPHIQAFRFLRYGEDPDALQGLALRSRIALYAGNVLGAPRDLLSVVRFNRTNEPGYSATFGAMSAQLGWGAEKSTFVSFSPPPAVVPAEEMVFSAATRNQFRFGELPFPQYQMHFLRLIVNLLKSNHVAIEFIHIPRYSERASDRVNEDLCWPELFSDGRIQLVGISPRVLFEGLSEADVGKLYYNEHLNKNGSRYFTSAVMPAILRTFERVAAGTESR